MLRWLSYIRVITLVAAFGAVCVIAFAISPDDDIEAASQAYRSGDYDQALRLSRRAMLFSGDNALESRALGLMAQAGQKLDNPAYAMECWDDLIARGEAKPWVYLSRGELKMQLGDNRGALADFDAGLGGADLASGSAKRLARFFAMRGLVHMELNQAKECMADAKTALELNPRSPDGRYLASRILAKQGKPKEALLQMEAALALAQKRDMYFFMSKKGKTWTEWVVRLRMKNKVDPTRAYKGE